VWEGQAARDARLNTGLIGAHVVVPFQCEICWMRNLEGRNPHSIDDRLYTMCIRRVNLDAINSRAAGTLATHLGNIKSMLETCAEIGRTPNLPQRGPFPLADQVGMGVAVEMQMKSIRNKGRIVPNIQWESLRKARGTQTKMWASSPIGIAEGSTFSGFNRRVSITSAPTQSEFFSDFLSGAKDRMGHQTKNQLSVPIGVVVRMLELVELDITVSENVSNTKALTRFGTLVTILTAASLRGHEGFYLDIAATRKYLNVGKVGTIPSGSMKNKILSEAESKALPRVCICLMGKFKGETGERYHSIILANESTSGLRIRNWVERLIAICVEEGRTSGYAFNDSEGHPPSPTEYNALVRQYIQIIQDEDDSLFDAKTDLARYGISRTFRKTSETRALRAGVPKGQVETVNRWRKIERAGAKKPNFNMADHYADASQLGTLTWRYSYAL